MSKLLRSMWHSTAGFVVVAALSAVFEVASFIGFPSLEPGKVKLTLLACFVVFAVSMGRALYLEHEKVSLLSDPKIVIGLEYASTKQPIFDGQNTQETYHRRIIISNASAVILKDCALNYVRCTQFIPNLSSDTPLPVKDDPNGSRKTDINRGDKKHFDLFITYLFQDTEAAVCTRICAPNLPTIPFGAIGEHLFFLRLTGSNFEPRTIECRANLGRNVEITHLRELELDRSEH